MILDAKQEAPILQALLATPLDRIRLNRTLAQYRHNCAHGRWRSTSKQIVDIDDALTLLEVRGLIGRLAHPLGSLVTYHLTEAGWETAAVSDSLSEIEKRGIRQVALENSIRR